MTGWDGRGFSRSRGGTPKPPREAAGLRAWDGNGAVQLHAVMDLAGTAVLLLERCEPGTPLTDVTEEDQDGMVAGLLHRLWIEPPPRLRLPATGADVPVVGRPV